MATYFDQLHGNPQATRAHERKINFCVTCTIWFYVHEWPADDHVIGRNMWPCLVMYNAISYIDDIRNYLMACIDTTGCLR